jgi:hypothetical protein
VIVASHRQGRTHLPRADQCPLCPSRDGRQTEIPAADYDVVVFENRFPSLTSEPGEVPDGGAFQRQPGIGRCEVVCFTSDHGGALAGVPVCRIRTVVEVWADRTLQLGALEGVEQIFPFENRGEEIGVTLRPSPRPDLRLPVRGSEDGPPAGRGPRAEGSHRRLLFLLNRCRRGGRRAGGRPGAGLAGLRPLRRRLAVRGPPVSDPPPGTCPTCQPSMIRSAKAWQRSSRGYSAASRRCSTSPCPTCSPAIRPRCGATATWPTCTWRLSRSAGRPPS